MRSAVGGADGSRTHDLSIANAALSQLSYGPGKDAEVYPRRFRLATIMRKRFGECRTRRHPRARGNGMLPSVVPGKYDAVIPFRMSEMHDPLPLLSPHHVSAGEPRPPHDAAGQLGLPLQPVVRALFT